MISEDRSFLGTVSSYEGDVRANPIFSPPLETKDYNNPFFKTQYSQYFQFSRIFFIMSGAKSLHHKVGRMLTIIQTTTVSQATGGLTSPLSRTKHCV
jgi:hypothetical protein